MRWQPVGFFLGAGAAGLFVLWLQRAPLVERFALGALERRGVPAAGRVIDASSSALTLEDARIGSADAPDATARRLTVRFSAWDRRLVGVTAEGLRVRAALDGEGRLRLGALDRLLPPPDGRPPRLPDLDLRLRDVQVTVATPYGVVAARLDGEGNPAGRFTGRARLLPASFAIAACTLPLAGGDVRLAAERRRGRVAGSLVLGPAACGATRAAGGRIEADVRLSDPILGGAGRIAVMLRAVRAGGARAEQVRATCEGRSMGSARPERVACVWHLDASGLAAEGWSARALTHAAPLTVDLAREPSARWRQTTAMLIDVAADPSLRASVARPLSALSATPLGPLEAAARVAAVRAAASFDVSAEVEPALDANGLVARIDGAQAAARSGARAVVTGDAVLAGGRLAVGSPLVVGVGGGLPRVRFTTGPDLAGGRAEIGRWSEGGAQLGATTLNWRREGETVTLSGPVRISGPLGPGRVDGLALPDAALAMRLSEGGTALALPRCLAVRAERMTQPRYVLAGAEGRLCPVEVPLLAVGDPASPGQGGGRGDRLFGGFRIDGFRGAGTLAGTTFTLDVPAVAARIGGTAERAQVAFEAWLARGTATLAGEARAFAFDRFTGLARQGAVGWAFDGDFAGGRAAANGVELGGAEGRWAMNAGGRLTLAAGTGYVRDTASPPRFAPLRLADGTAAYAKGQARFGTRLLHAPTATPLGRVDGSYAASAEAWHADLSLAVPFGPDLQPYQLSETARGVVENVTGTVQLTAALRYDGGLLSGPGRLQADGLDFATAALGPVRGVKADIAFTDLPSLTSEPSQTVSIASVNPGIELRNGDGSIKLLGQGKVRVDSLVFPFAGGALRLKPTMLDPATPERDFVAEVEGLDVARFVDLLKIKDLYATGRFDGLLPLRLSAQGGRIEGGVLTARPPGGVIRYVGTIGDDLPAGATLAFGALKALRYETLSLGVNGDIDGEIVTSLNFTGANEAAVKAGGPAALPPGTPFRFKVGITAPFRRLLGTVGGFNDARPLITQGLEPLSPPQRPKPD